MTATADKEGTMTLTSKAALKVLAHALKFPDVPVLGLLVGTPGIATNAIPLYHSLVYPTLAVAVQQVRYLPRRNYRPMTYYVDTGDPLCGDVQ
jgi:hypothetical protein